MISLFGRVWVQQGSLSGRTGTHPIQRTTHRCRIRDRAVSVVRDVAWRWSIPALTYHTGTVGRVRDGVMGGLPCIVPCQP